MSLVAYGGSSDEFSEDEESSEVIFNKPTTEIKSQAVQAPIKNGFLGLPPPKNHSSDAQEEEEPNKIEDEEIDMDKPLQFNLPPSKAIGLQIEEEDDEFLRKKAVPPQRKPVRITIPSLSDFKDEEITVKPNQNMNRAANKLSGLLGMLPKPKSEIVFVTKPGDEKKATMIPHSVLNKSKNVPAPSKKHVKKPVENKLIANYSDSDSDGEAGTSSDFFSLQVEDKLPEVSMNEINAMVAKKAAKIAETASMFEKMASGIVEEQIEEEEVAVPQPIYNNSKLDEEAMQQLCGVKGKRKRYQEQMNVIDISSSELTNRDEWLRNTLASSTEHQSKKNSSGEDLIPGSKRKHQITYLANQAIANEHELQAMWSQNRQSRRTTQNKYGF